MMRITCVCLWVLACGFLHSNSAAAQTRSHECTIIKLFNGRVHKGVVLKETDQEIVIRTWVGDKKITRHNIVDIRRNLSAADREAILRSIDPWEDEKAWRERDKEFAAGKKVDTPRVILPPRTKRAVSGPTIIRSDPVRGAMGGNYGVASQGTWGQRMLAALDKRLTLEFKDEKLENALDLVRSLTALNIIVNPKVLEAQPTISLRVQGMDAATVLKWLTRLSNTHIDVRDQALYVTDQPPKEAEDEERMEALMMMTRAGVDPAEHLPPPDTPLTDADRVKIATAIWKKTNPKPPDFPGPEISLGVQAEQQPFNPFAPGN